MVEEARRNARRYARVTAGNLRNNHIYITGDHDFFPRDCVGGSNVTSGTGRPVAIELAGLGKRVETDIPVDARTGKPRHHFRARYWVRDFFAHHQIDAGDLLCLERLGTRSYRLSVACKPHDARGFKFLEFFAGIGLIRLGLEKKGWRVIYANDIDPQKQEMYAANFNDGEVHFELGDIHELDVSKIPTATLATASFPCTDLSVAGERKGLNGGQSSAFFGFINVLAKMGDCRPPLVLIENVTGFLTSHGGNDLHQALAELNGLGYCVDVFVLDARWFVPQSRPRLFVVASSNPSCDAGYSPFLLPSSRTRPPLLAQFITCHPDICWALRALPEPPSKATKSLTDILEHLPNDAPDWWSTDRAKYLYNQMSTRHRTIADTWISQRKWSYGTVFRRVRHQPDGCRRSMAELRSDGLAGCLRTPKGGSGRQILFKAGYGKYAARLLTPRECARLMGADDFVIQAPLNQSLFAFGDGVCVPAISWIAENYLNPLAQSANFTRI